MVCDFANRIVCRAFVWRGKIYFMINKYYNYSLLCFFLPFPIFWGLNYFFMFLHNHNTADMMPVNTWMFFTYLGCTVLFWALICFFLIKSKGLSLKWLTMALLGQLGLIVLVLLGDKTIVSPPPRRRIFLRIFGEIAFFIGIIFVSWLLTGWIEDLQNIVGARQHHLSLEEYIKQYIASNNMNTMNDIWLFLTAFTFLYLIRPRVLNFLLRLTGE